MKEFLLSLIGVAIFLVALELNELNKSIIETNNLQKFMVKLESIDITGKYCKNGSSSNWQTNNFDCK